MSFGGFDESRHAAPMAEINVTPMVDVMLVLLVIFILAAPLFTHGLRLDLPGAAAAPLPAPAATVVLSIDAAGKLYWNDEAIGADALAARMASAAAKNPQPDLQLRADRATRYEVIADVLATAQANNLTKIGFVTQPKPGTAPDVGTAPKAGSVPNAGAAPKVDTEPLPLRPSPTATPSPSTGK